MTIDSEVGHVPAKTTIGGDHRHNHAGAHPHAHDVAAPTAGFSPFLASALDRLAVAVVFAGLVWIGVFWAVR